MNQRAFPEATGRVPPGAIGHNRGVVRPNYAFMPPEGVLISRLPQYKDTIVRVLAAPVLGADFAQYVFEIAPGGGTTAPFAEEDVQHFFYGLAGEAAFSLGDAAAKPLAVGGFAYPPRLSDRDHHRSTNAHTTSARSPSQPNRRHCRGTQSQHHLSERRQPACRVPIHR